MRIEERYKNGYIVFAFVLAATLIMLVYPGEVKFKYVYQKNKAWQYDDLIAPFSFPLQKTAAEMAADKERLEEYKDLFFIRSANVESEVTSQIISDWQKLLLDWPTLQKDSLGLFRALRFVYKRGIVDGNAITDADVKNRMLLVENKKVEAFLASDYMTLVGAEATVSEALHYAKDFESTLADYLSPNILLDPVMTDHELKVAIARHLETSEGISEGEIIIHKGSVVDDQKFTALQSMQAAFESKVHERAVPFQLLIGQFIFISVLFATLFAFLVSFRSNILKSIAHINLVLVSVVWMVALAITVIKANPSWLYIVPFPIIPIILRAFYDTRLALFVHIIIIMLIGYYAPNSFEFIFLEFTAGVAAIIYVTGLYKRSQLFVAMSKIMAVYAIAYIGFVLLKENGIHHEQWVELAYLGGSGILSLFAFPLIFGYEKIFGQVSDLTLLELADTNSPLLRELAQKAPGTFQHSFQVANLAEQAALTIGANTLLVRTGALYHDIGKMINPEYFIENLMAGNNPHDQLTHKESAEIIIGHVPAGVKIGKKEGLPADVIDCIQTHHGTTRVEYFYRQYIKSFRELEGDEQLFTYPGPRPSSKEMAILMMADSTEAAARSLKEKTADSLNNLVESVIDGQLQAGQFNKADITLRDIDEIKTVFKQLLANIYHTRIAYPEKVS